MRVIAKRPLRIFWERFPDAHGPLLAWYREMEKASFATPAELKEKYRTASFVRDRVVFNIRGNRYRLVVRVRYDKQIVLVRFVGTHEEYDGIDAGRI